MAKFFTGTRKSGPSKALPFGLLASAATEGVIGEGPMSGAQAHASTPDVAAPQFLGSGPAAGAAFGGAFGERRNAAALEALVQSGQQIPVDFARSGGDSPKLVPDFSTGTGVFEPLVDVPGGAPEVPEALQRTFSRQGFFQGKPGLFEQRADGSITLNGRETKRSMESIWREFLRSRGIRRQRINASPRNVVTGEDGRRFVGPQHDSRGEAGAEENQPDGARCLITTSFSGTSTATRVFFQRGEGEARCVPPAAEEAGVASLSPS